MVMDSFRCEICNRDERYESDWLHHISSLGHQRSIARRAGGGHGHWSDPALQKRCVKITGCEKVKATPYEIGEYVTKIGGKLEEFCCPTSITGTKPPEIFCLFQTEESVQKILDLNSYRISGHPVEIKLKYSDLPSNDDTEVVKSDLDYVEDEGTGNGKRTSSYEEECWTIDMKLEDQLPKLFQDISLSPKEAQKRTKMAKDIQEILRQTFSNAFVFSYGTDGLNLGMKNDTIRLCVDPYGILGSKSHGVIGSKGGGTDQMSSNLIFQILSTYQAEGESAFKFVSVYSISPVAAFTIPEISLTYKDTICKFQFENFLSVQKCRLVKFLTKHDLRIWPILMLVRHWSRVHEIFHAHTEGEEFENYSLILLVLFYLTKTKVIPSVIHIQSKSSSPLVVNNIDISFCSDPKVIQPNKLSYLEDKSIRTLSTLSILKEFFNFFAKTDLNENVVCTAIGELVPRRMFKPQMERELPELLRNRYRLSANGDPKAQKLNTFTPICVQDPLDLTENVTRGVDEVDVCQFQNACTQTADSLQSLIESSKPNLMLIFRSLEEGAKRKRGEIKDGDPLH